ncbi:MAG: flavin-containing monooxygenase [Jatrophihabitans sp.]|uniref:flavin-containing monooxygenase n=1 Tax=Jatrophihabitans sp. TaxID=1932789 RepID=UPI003F7FE0F8
MSEHLDVVVIGAGLSGIGAGYRLVTERPGTSFAVLEARQDLGGTWDLFRYPGIRSDSDMATFGYAFKPWLGDKTLADGSDILAYVRETAREHGIDRHIRYGTRVTSADWSTSEQRWHLALEVDGEPRELTCGFLYSCAGYYRYDRGHTPEFPGIADFAGQVVHPQFWPEDLDHAGKRVVIIGSGATAVTLLPNMADTAAHVTMLQRSPTWISAVPSRDKIADRARALLPAHVAHTLVRGKNILRSQAIYQFCRSYPQQARKLLTGLTTKILQDEAAVAEHFTPSYDPWDQRICAAPGADFYKALKHGSASVVTATIDTFVPEGIRLSDGRVLEADLVITATGLELLPFGGIAPKVDGVTVPLDEQFVWRGAMITGIPNFAVCVGYTNASWTLRADLSSRLVCKVLEHMQRRGLRSVVPVAPEGMTPRPLLDLTSGYVQRSIDAFPRQGDHHPWTVRQNYLLDSMLTLRGDLGRDLAPAGPAVSDGAGTQAGSSRSLASTASRASVL